MVESLIRDNPKLNLEKSNHDQLSVKVKGLDHAVLTVKSVNRCHSGIYRVCVAVTASFLSLWSIMNKYIVIEHSVCKVFEVSRHDRCYKCLTSGHKAKSCNNTAVCSRCAGPHRSSNCDSDTKKCIFCVRKGLADHNHYSYDCIL